MGIPNLSLIGVVKRPNRVVDPTRVKGFNSIRNDLAAEPSPTIKSQLKSSIAG